MVAVATWEAKPKPGDGVCLHCRRLGNINRRSLCTRCYLTPDIRAKYPTLLKRPAACRHCGRGKPNRPRGLCFRCFDNLTVRSLYPSTSKYARKGAGTGNGNAPLPEPTDAAPGTPEKMAVLAARAAAGQRLWHPLDRLLPAESDRPFYAPEESDADDES